jgi:hypothetical protein
MVVSALVVLLPANATRRADVLARLACDPRVALGAVVGDFLPIVAETEHAQEGAQLVEELCDLAGVRVDVVALDFGATP